MEKNLTSRLLFIAGMGCAIAGWIFLLIAIFVDDASDWILIFALLSSVLSMLFHLIRNQFNKKND